jgi:hypothetical protein
VHVVFDTDESFSFETLRALGYAVYGGADVGEVLTAAQRVTPGDWESWYREWRAMADRVADTSARAIATIRSAPDGKRHWERVRIPYDGVDLDGYYLHVSGDEPGPTLLAHGGFDSTVEEMFFTVGEAARRYGWARANIATKVR